MLVWLALATLGAQEWVAPHSAPRFGIAEFAVRDFRTPNCFVDARLNVEFTAPDQTKLHAQGFCDGDTFRLRFSPHQTGVYRYIARWQQPDGQKLFRGQFTATPASGDGPVVARGKHFEYLGSARPFFHLGYTAYHLLDVSRSEKEIDATIEFCARNGFNKIRFLLTGYPRDTDRRTSNDNEYGVRDLKKAPNYGAPPGRVNPLPAWEGEPHAYDFTRFHLPHWRRAEYAIAKMQQHGIVATCIFTIEKQDLPKEYGRLSDAEYRLYAYAIARLGAFSNVWWDLGNEHNEFRDKDWGDAMGAFVAAADPHQRLRSAHAYADFWYGRSSWPSFIITQQYGAERQLYDWVRKHDSIPMPYVNEEYGYEGPLDTPGHQMNADWVRRGLWSIVMAGGYATYGEHGKEAYFYTGQPGPAAGATQLQHARRFFEALPFASMKPCDDPRAFCLEAPSGPRVLYFTKTPPPIDGGRWFDPRTGQFAAKPGEGDWVWISR